MDWAEGCPVESDYTFGYYRQLNPVFARFALVTAGIAAPAIHTACELGYGHGVSAAIHQAASGATWWGTDFMPGQAAHAQELAGPGAVLAEQSFAEFCSRPDLPDFDFVCAHGIWSWVSAENRAVIVDFLRRKLRPGGIFYVSYNTEVGWAALHPFRHLLLRHTELMSPRSLARVEAIRQAMPFIKRVFDAQSVYTAQNPMASFMLAHTAQNVSPYDPHEYLVQHWQPMNVADVAAELAPAKLSYGCSARLLDQMPALTRTPEQQALMDGIADPEFSETVGDVMSGLRFRRDYWVKGPRTLGPAERSHAVADLRVVLVEAPGDVSQIRAQTPVGEVTLPMETFKPVIEELSDHLPHRLGDLAGTLSSAGMGASHVLQAVLVLCEIGLLQPAHSVDAAIETASGLAAALNARILARARHRGELGHLSRPVTGGATEVTRLEQLLLLAEQSKASPEDVACSIAAELDMPVLEVHRKAETFQSGRRNILRKQRVM